MSDLRARTNRQITSLCRDLKMSRSRLDEFINQETPRDIGQLTINEYMAMRKHPTFSSSLPLVDTPVKPFKIVHLIKFKLESAATGLELLKKHLATPLRAVGGELLEILVDKGSPESWDVMLSYPVETLRVAEGWGHCFLSSNSTAPNGTAATGFFDMDHDDQVIFYSLLKASMSEEDFLNIMRQHLDSVWKRVVFVSLQLSDVPKECPIENSDEEEEEENFQLDFLNKNFQQQPNTVE